MINYKVPFNNLRPAIDLCRPELDAAYLRVMENGNFILGDEVKAFEKELAAYANTTYAIGVGNGTDAITLALLASGIGGPQTNVLTVANSAPPTVVGIRNTGAKIQLTEINERGLINLKTLNSKKLDGIKAIVPVYLYGRVPDYEHSFMKLVEGSGVKIIEDCCQALGSKGLWNTVGSYSEASCLSFYPTKNLGCFGDGGAVLTNSKTVYERMLLLRNYGSSGGKIYLTGFNSRLDELQAAFLRVRLKTLDEICKAKVNINDVYFKELIKTKGVIDIQPTYRGDNCHLCPVNFEKRDELKKHMDADGIQTIIHYQTAAHLNPLEMFGEVCSLPITEAYCKTVLSLPNWYGISMDDIQFVVKSIRSFYA